MCHTMGDRTVPGEIMLSEMIGGARAPPHLQGTYLTFASFLGFELFSHLSNQLALNLI